VTSLEAVVCEQAAGHTQAVSEGNQETKGVVACVMQKLVLLMHGLKHSLVHF
jgi:hypothetical protein